MVGLATAMAWLGDRGVALWSIGVLWIIGRGNVAALSHLRRHGMTDLPWKDRWSFWAFRLRILLGVAWAVGILLVIGDGGGSIEERGGWSYAAGLVVGSRWRSWPSSSPTAGPHAAPSTSCPRTTPSTSGEPSASGACRSASMTTPTSSPTSTRR